VHAQEAFVLEIARDALDIAGRKIQFIRVAEFLLHENDFLSVRRPKGSLSEVG